MGQHQPEQVENNVPAGWQENPSVGKPKKRIVLFSDGTGNSSARLQKTNVWRLYQAIDLGNLDNNGVLQIGYYDDGVGTSSIKPIALVGGIFGYGLKRNIIQLYSYLCRNYVEGDEIYLFGFSRGAYTIRILAAMIANQGVVTGIKNERELSAAARNAYSEFMRFNEPHIFPFIARVSRAIRDFFLKCRDKIFSHDRDVYEVMNPDIEFLGVWDTVGAYGGPIIEVTEAIDNWILPLGMTDYMLSPKVKRARHALSLDDERASFRPLVWDEVNEDEKHKNRLEMSEGLSLSDCELSRLYRYVRIEESKAKDQTNLKQLLNHRPSDATTLREWDNRGDILYHNRLQNSQESKEKEQCEKLLTKHKLGRNRVKELYELRNFSEKRMKQVWFAGMHSDVGGGYPDESLSYVSLVWMMDELQDWLTFLSAKKAEYENAANIFGPIHNSRKGLASYYRYLPRRISVFMDFRHIQNDNQREAKIRQTLGYRDPMVTFKKQSENDQVNDKRYSGLLTSCCVHWSVVHRIESGTDNYAPMGITENFSVEGNVERAANFTQNSEMFSVLETKSANTGQQKQFAVDLKTLWPKISQRRVIYFLNLLTTLSLVMMPIWSALLEPSTEKYWSFKNIILQLKNYVTDVSSYVLDLFSSSQQHPIIFWGLVITIVILMYSGTHMEGALRSKSRSIWLSTLDSSSNQKDPWPEEPHGFWGQSYQRVRHFLHWRFIPNMLGVLIVFGIPYIVITFFHQSWPW